MVPAHQGELSTAEGGPVRLDLVIFLRLQLNLCTITVLSTPGGQSGGRCRQVVVKLGLTVLVYEASLIVLKPGTGRDHGDLEKIFLGLM